MTIKPTKKTRSEHIVRGELLIKIGDNDWI